MAVITLTPSTTFQTMGGWEATAQAGETDSPVFSSYSDYLFNQAVNDLGINRLRFEIFTTRVGTPSTFDFSGTFDPVGVADVVPMRNKLIARGESLWINVCFVYHSATDINMTTPSTYAAGVLATYQHMQSTFGFLPDSWEICLEPDNFGWPSATVLGNCLVAAGNALVGGGFTPYFVVPSNVNPGNAISYWNTMVTAVPAVLSSGYVKEFSYHRYTAPTTPQLQSIATIGSSNNIKIGMMEHIAADQNELYNDLTIANCSNWQQFTLAYPTGDDGAQYYPINNSGGTPQTQVTIGSRTKFLRQYFKFIRRGAIRVAAATDSSGSFDPVAFINTDGGYVVVVKTTSSGSMTINGLANGTYAIKYTTGAAYDIDLAPQTIAAGSLTTSIPAAGVLTVSSSRAPLTAMTLTDVTNSVLDSNRVSSTFNNIGVELRYTGDTDLNSTAVLEYRQTGATNWLATLPLYRSDGTLTDKYHTGSILFVKSGTTYDLRITVTDGSESAVITATATTRTEPADPRTVAANRFLDANIGSDANTGIIGSPVKTLRRAVVLANAATSDQIWRVADGDYVAPSTQLTQATWKISFIGQHDAADVVATTLGGITRQIAVATSNTHATVSPRGTDGGPCTWAPNGTIDADLQMGAVTDTGTITANRIGPWDQQVIADTNNVNRTVWHWTVPCADSPAGPPAIVAYANSRTAQTRRLSFWRPVVAGSLSTSGQDVAYSYLATNSLTSWLSEMFSGQLYNYGCWSTGSDLYARFPDDVNPNTLWGWISSEFSISGRGRAFTISHTDTTFSGIEFRGFATGIQTLTGGDRLLVDRCLFEGCNNGIYDRGVANGGTGSTYIIDPLVQKSVFRQRFAWEMDNVSAAFPVPWRFIKSTPGKGNESSGYAGDGHGRRKVVRYCTFDGVFDGINYFDSGYDRYSCSDHDVHDCLFTHLADDALDLSFNKNNVRIYHNRIQDASTFNSFASTNSGAVYMAFNEGWRIGSRGIRWDFLNSPAASMILKVGGTTPPPRIFWMHNTVWTDTSIDATGRSTGTFFYNFAGGGTASLGPRFYFRNNIVRASGAGTLSSGVLGTVNAPASGITLWDDDYNDWSATAGVTPGAANAFFNISGSTSPSDSTATFRTNGAANGIGSHSSLRSATFSSLVDAQLIAPTTGDLRLIAASTLTHGGVPFAALTPVTDPAFGANLISTADAALSAKATLFDRPRLQIAWAEIQLLSTPAGQSVSSTTTTTTQQAVKARAVLSTAALVTTVVQNNIVLSANSVLSTGNYVGTVLADNPGGYWRLAELSGPGLISIAASFVLASSNNTVYLTATGTTWTVDTNWTITFNGSTLSASVVTVTSPTTATWVLTTGSGNGTITISDGTISGTLLVGLVVAVDSSGHGNTGTYNGSVALGRTGAFTSDSHTSVLFDGISSDVAVIMPPSTTYAMEAWVKSNGTWPTTAPSSNLMVLSTFTGGDFLAVNGAATSGTAVFIVNQAVAGQDGVSDGVLATNTWYHLIGVYNSKSIELYVNGFVVAGIARVGSEYGTSGLGHIGSDLNLAAFFNGYIQDVAFYPQILSPAQVLTHYLSSRASAAIKVSINQTISTIASITTSLVSGTTSALISTSTVTTISAVKAPSTFSATTAVVANGRSVSTATLLANAVLTLPVSTVKAVSQALYASAAASLTPTGPGATPTIVGVSIVGTSVIGTTFSVVIKATISPIATATLVAIPAAVSAGAAAFICSANLTNAVTIRVPTTSTTVAAITNTPSTIQASATVSTTSTIVAIPTLIILKPISNPTLTTTTIAMTGINTTWNDSTNWQITLNGATLSASQIIVIGTGNFNYWQRAQPLRSLQPVNYPTPGLFYQRWTVATANWVLTTGPNTGTITISDGVATGILLVTPGGPALPTATSTLSSTNKIAVAETISTTATLQPIIRFSGSAALTATAAITTISAVIARANLTAVAATVNQIPVLGSATLSATTNLVTSAASIAAAVASTAVFTLTTTTRISAVATLSASTLATIFVGFYAPLSATASIATSQDVAVGQTLSAAANMLPVPSGNVPGFAVLTAITALVTTQAIANTTLSTAQESIATAVAVRNATTISFVADTQTISGPTIDESLVSLANVSTTQGIETPESLSVQTDLLSNQGSANDIGLITTTLLSVDGTRVILVDVRPLSFVLMDVVDGIATQPLLTTIATIAATGSSINSTLISSAALVSFGVIGTVSKAALHSNAALVAKTSVTRTAQLHAVAHIFEQLDGYVLGDAELIITTTMKMAFPSKWHGKRKVSVKIIDGGERHALVH